MKFTEEKLEKAFVELLENENFPHFHGGSIARAADEVLIEEDLLKYLLTKYHSKHLTPIEAKSIVLQLKTLPSSDLYESNKTIMRWLSDGFILKREDRNQKDIHIELIDYNGLEAQMAGPDLDHLAAESSEQYPSDYNIYKFVNQFEIVGSEKRIPDGIIYINGLPVVVFEFKSAIREEATIHDAFKQLTIRYRRDIPELFKYNAFCVISDGVNNKAGSFFAPYEFFYAWRRVLGSVKLQLHEMGNVKLQLHDKNQEAEGIDSMFTLVQGMLNQNRLRDIIRNFIYLPDSSKKDEKIVCRYPQYYAAKRLYDTIKLAQKPQGDGKGGTYFGATGSGKSFTMLYLTRLLMKSVYFESPTIVLITDRTDLDDQLSGQFTNAKKFIGDNTVVSVESRANLRELVQGRQSGGVFLTTIHKFTEDTELLTERRNVICISDEAHRSQVNLDQKIKVTEKGVSKTFGFAKYLHDSLPNATFVGFTGTPIDATLDVFGKVVDAYTMTESVRDEITVRIVYEGRAAKVALNNSELEKIEQYYQEVAEAGGNEYQIEKSKETTATMNTILGDPDRLQALAEDFVKHYESRINEGASVKGKAMFVCSSREIAYAFYKNVIAYLGERSSSSFNTFNYASSFTKKYGAPEEWHSGNLPHRDKEGLIQFITFRLADSLPQDVLQEVENEIKDLSDTDKPIQKRIKYEKWLDNGLGCCALANPEMAQVVVEALKYHDGEKYDLLAWSIMPNHVHVLIKANSNLSRIIQSWKSFTGKWALTNNKKYNLGISKEAAEFWMPEYWDRFIRDEQHFNNTIKYILENPKKANLPNPSTAYRFTGCAISNEMKLELQPSQIKMIMTRGKDDPKEMYDLLGTKDYRKELDRQFKSAKSN
ncbi:HsdR family type I site-specific deoxyribonuclease, partial [Mariniphaga sediminis]|uniref:HsdR family type I site-specific deoxyribonuclease n=1 Tax=Mariniphaga sediminis TaxID=1628158 RepID=UPI003566A368